MKVLQTLGSSGQSGEPTAFFYRRQPGGVYTKEPGTNGRVHTFTDDEWQAILAELHGSSRSFSLSEGLYSILNRAADRAGISHWQAPEKAKIAAILEHEGSIDHAGTGNRPINLISDI